MAIIFLELGWWKGRFVATGLWEMPPCAVLDLLFTTWNKVRLQDVLASFWRGVVNGRVGGMSCCGRREMKFSLSLWEPRGPWCSSCDCLHSYSLCDFFPLWKGLLVKVEILYSVSGTWRVYH